MDDAFPHTNGSSIAGFTPNMSQEQIAEFDRRRGLGDMGTFKEPDFLINKKPWLRADGTHKAQDEGDMSKTQEAIQTLKGMRVPDQGQQFAKDADGVKEKDDVDEDIGDKLFGKADKFGMASAQRAHQRESGRRERSIGMRHAGKSGDESAPDPTSEKDDVVLLEKLLNHEKEEELEEEKKGMVLPGETSKFDAGGMSSAPAPSPASSAPSTGPSAGGVGPSMGIGKSMDALKALNSRSMHIPAPHGPYDPFGIQRSGSAVPTSGSMPHEGTPHTLQTAHATHDVCSAHGITYRKSLGCAPCALAKSFECKTCGTTMHKSFGGVYRCARGH